MTPDQGRAALARAHETMSPAAIADHALQLAELLAKLHGHVLPSVSNATAEQGRLVDAQYQALVALHAAVTSAMHLLERGQAAGAREILAKLAASPVPAPPQITVGSLPVLPDDIFSPDRLLESQ